MLELKLSQMEITMVKVISLKPLISLIGIQNIKKISSICHSGNYRNWSVAVNDEKTVSELIGKTIKVKSQMVVIQKC